MSIALIGRTVLGLAVAASASSAVAQNADFHRTIPVGERPDVYISTGSGDIRITPSNGNTVVVTGHVHAGWPHGGDVEARIRRVLADPPVQQNGNDIRIGEPSDRSILNNISIDYDVQVPAQAALNLHTGSGSAETQNVGRFVAAQSGSGTLRVRGVEGPAELHTGSGDIELEQKGQGGVHAQTGSGSLRLTGLKGPLQAHTGSGDLEASGMIEGPGELSTGSGNLRLRLSPGERLTIHASTGSGTVHADLPGVNATSEGSHDFQAQINGGGPTLTLHTGSGDISLNQQ